MPTSLEALTQINLDDLVTSFGWQNQPLLARLLRRTFTKPARTFANQMTDFDLPVATHGLAEAARLTLRHYVRDIRIFGAERYTCWSFSGFIQSSGHERYALTLCRVKAP